MATTPSAPSFTAMLDSEKDDVLDKLYHSPEGYVSPTKLLELVRAKAPSASITLTYIRKWYSQQPENQQMKETRRPKRFVPFITHKANDLHEADLVMMPTDPETGCKYLLNVIDAHSRYAVGVAISSKSADTLTKAPADVYGGKTHLTWPKVLQCDAGTEFKNAKVAAFVGKHGTTMRYAPAGDKRKMALIERFNRTITVPVYKGMRKKEILIDEETLKKTGKPSKYMADVKEWVAQIDQFVSAYNNRTHRMIRARPIDVITGKDTSHVSHAAAPDDDYVIPPGTRVRMQLEDHKRATDTHYGTQQFTVVESRKRDAFSPRVYYLADDQGNLLTSPSYFEELSFALVK